MRLYLLLFGLLVFSIKSRGQTLFTKCIQSCTPAGTQKGVIDQLIFNPTSDIIISGFGAFNFQGYYFSKNDSLNNLIWSKEFQWTIQDTVLGTIDTLYQRKRQLYKTEKLHENKILFSLEQDSIVYKIINSSLVFDRIGIKSSVLGMLDINGNILWSKIVDFNKHNRITHIAASADKIYFGGVYNDNYFQSNALGNQFFICMDTTGVVLWNRLILNSSSKTIIKTLSYFNEGILILSNDSLSTYLMKLDDIGNITWAFAYSNSYKLNGVDLVVSDDSTITILANNDPNTNKTCLLKLDSIGNLLWANSYYSSLVLYPKQIIKFQSDTIIAIMEQYGNSPRKVVSINVYPNGSNSNGNVFYQNTSSSSSNPPSSSYNYLQTVNRQGSYFIGNIDGANDFPIVGVHANFVNTIRFNSFMSSCSFNNYSTSISSNGLSININSQIIADSSAAISSSAYSLVLQSSNYPIVNMCSINVGLPDNTLLNDYIISPNPTNGKFKLILPDNTLSYKLIIYNHSGQIVYKLENNSSGEPVTVELPQALPSGIYELRAIFDDDPFHSKLILINN